MTINRRHFLLTSGGAGIGFTVLPGTVIADLLKPLKTVGRSGFERRRKDWFYLENPEATHQCYLQLTQVIDDGSDANVQQFALVLRSNNHTLPMPSGFYQVAAEPFDLFIKYTHEKGGRHYYRAEFALLQ